jgi:hypothetical protein
VHRGYGEECTEAKECRETFIERRDGGIEASEYIFSIKRLSGLLTSVPPLLTFLRDLPHLRILVSVPQ